MVNIRIDINDVEFQENLFSLEKNEQVALLRTLKKISELTWEKLYSDNGLKWEKITSKKTADQIYSFRFSKKYRAVGTREGVFLRLLSLHVDHDSAYR